MSDTTPSEQTRENKNERTLLSELIHFALITLLVVLPIRIYVAQPFIVSGSSMEPTFNNSDYLIIDEISYRLHEPRRGDVIVFRYPQDTTKFFIKRIIGLPGETVVVDGTTITVENDEYPEGFTLDESYLKHVAPSTSRIALGGDEYFVMGDNRPASSDSRVWGPLKDELIIGRALVRLLPVSQIDLFPGAHAYTDSVVGDSSEQ